jgi:hypothetical protein
MLDKRLLRKQRSASVRDGSFSSVGKDRRLSLVKANTLYIIFLQGRGGGGGMGRDGPRGGVFI